MLNLTINKKWFAKVVSGDQKEVYLTAIPFNEEKVTSVWGRDMSSWNNPQEVCFETEEGKKCRAMCTLAMGEGYPDWGAEKGVLYYVIRIQKTLDVPTEDAAENIEEVAKVIEEVKVVTEEATQALEEAAEVLEEADKAIEEAKQVIEETSKLVEEEEAEEEESVVEEETKAEEEPVEESIEEEPITEEEEAEDFECDGKCGVCPLTVCLVDKEIEDAEEKAEAGLEEVIEKETSDSTPIVPAKKDVK